jgi:hypothetical protein
MSTHSTLSGRSKDWQELRQLSLGNLLPTTESADIRDVARNGYWHCRRQNTVMKPLTGSFSNGETKRRDFMKTAAVLPASALLGGAGATVATTASAQSSGTSTAGFGSGTGSSGTEPRPDHKGVAYSDMTSYDDDGKPNAGFSDRSSKPKSYDPTAPYQMPLTDEEQAILNGAKGPELAKVMKILVDHGNAFNAGI